MEHIQEKNKYNFGLIGKGISYSFSRQYFSNKFITEALPHTYENFDIDTIEAFPKIINTTKNLKGLNVTIPYKQDVIPYLDSINPIAKEIGAVNTIKITNNKTLIGYNTDYYGFKASIEPFLKPYHKSALIFGTGGASKAVVYVLELLGIYYNFVSRNQNSNIKWTYNTLTEKAIAQHLVLINCTPVGTFPNVSNCLPIPYSGITTKHLVYDLIYNPAITEFLKRSAQNGATTINGLKMLELQAQKAWDIWTE